MPGQAQLGRWQILNPPLQVHPSLRFWMEPEGTINGQLMSPVSMEQFQLLCLMTSMARFWKHSN